MPVLTPTQWFAQILNNFLNIVVWPVFITISICMFVWAGFLYLSANGDSTKIASANKAVVYGIIGIVVAILGFSAVGTIRTIITPYDPGPSTLSCVASPVPACNGTGCPAGQHCGIPGNGGCGCVDDVQR